MCGELDDEGPTSLQEAHYNRFMLHARAILDRREKAPRHPPTTP